MYQQKKLNDKLISEIKIREETENSLRESEERLRIVTDTTQSAFITINDSNIVLSWNRAAERIFGFSKEEAINQNVFALIVPEEKKAEYEELILSLKKSTHAALAGNIVELVAIDKNRRIFPMELSISTIMINGERYVTGLINDISKRVETERALAESEENLRKFIETTPIGIYRTTPDGKILYANPHLVKMLGYNSLVELQSINLEEEGFENIEKRKKFKEIIERDGEVSSYNGSYIRADKSKLYVNEFARCVRNELGNVDYYEGIIEDVTDRKLAEKELIRSESLLRELNSTKDRFFSIIAHDLKNPLGSCIMTTEALISSWDSFDEDEKKDLIGHMKTNSKNLFQLLDNLLTWARSQSDKIEFNQIKFDLYQVAEEISTLVIMTAKNKGIEFSSLISENTYVFADYFMISTVLRNLISNALKFTKSGGSVALSANFNVNEENFITVSIADTGIGMDKTDSDNLFRLDVRQSTLGTADEKGTGLGLLISKDFVEKNGGKIWAVSEKGKGTTFCFTIQKYPGSQNEEKKSTPEDVGNLI